MDSWPSAHEGHRPERRGIFLAHRFIRIARLFYLACLVMLSDALRAGLPIDSRALLNSLIFVPIFDGDTDTFPLHYLGWTLAFETTVASRAGLKLLGDASYPIYLSHLFVVLFLREVLNRMPFDPDLVVLVTLVLSAVVGICVYRWVEEAPVEGWAAKPPAMVAAALAHGCRTSALTGI